MKGVGERGVKNTSKIKNPGGVGSYVKFLTWWGYGYFLEPHNAKVKNDTTNHCDLNVPELPKIMKENICLNFNFWMTNLNKNNLACNYMKLERWPN